TVIDDKSCMNIYYLYQTLIKEVPVKNNNKIDSFTYDAKICSEEYIQSLIKNKNANYCMEFCDELEYKILDNNIKVISYKCFFNNFARDYEYNESGNNYILFVEDKEDKKMYNSTMLFKNQEELEVFLDKEDHIEIMEQSILLSEVIKNNI
ncbi:MAG: hypothetical protein LUG12_10960, partial [Erysipelotrichaceae bacterium]|nr:hypothetical protein [Erysipelotrichaceae bacterium]